MLLASTIRLLAFVLGAALSAFLAALFARKKPATPPGRLALAAILAAGAWQASSAIAAFHRAVAGPTNTMLLGGLDQVGIAALALIPTLVLHLVWLWSRVPVRGIAAAYIAVPLAWWSLESGQPKLYGSWLVVAFLASSALCAWAAWRGGAPVPMRRFLAAFAVALLAVPAAGVAGGPGSAGVAGVCLAPPLVLTWWIYRYNLFGLLIGSRLVFALKMGFLFALYLLIVRGLARLVEEEFEAFGALVELALIFAAAMVWLPLYGWMSRFLSRRATVYAAFSKRLIEEAARILELRLRVQFLADEVGRTFGLHRALLVTGGDAPLVGRYGPPNGGPADSRDWQTKLFPLAHAHRADMVRTTGNGNPEFGELLSQLGFNYLFPLWYEDRLNGLLLLDTSPRLFLDEDEAILLGLSGQISHSLETGRVIEEKIGLERKLAHQEHLATLGAAAATMAHEVKNPLSSIKTLTQLMREDPEVESRYSRDLSFILGEVDRLNRTVQQLLSFSRPGFEREEEVNLSELLALTAEVLAREHAAGNIRIEYTVEPQLRLRKASTGALQQVVLNLVLNAIQVSPPGSTVKLEAGAVPEGNIAIAVTDQGPGIPPAVRERMFEPFFTTRHKGTGLGLAIVRKNVQEMRGAIDVESPVAANRGARLTITLPCD
jgi:signal transduction histidine kinase